MNEERAGRMRELMTDLYPLCRSITGPGARATLDRIAAEVPIDVHHVPSGTQVLDWTVPDEWSIRDAYVADATGRRVVDFQVSNLHVVNYSEPVSVRLSLDELLPRLHSLPDRPSLVPYRTSYYNRTWGFCLSHDELTGLTEGSYDVHIDATLSPGLLSYGELVIPGDSPDEILITTHICHPSLANDNLSGIAAAIEIGRELSDGATHRHTFRLLFIPGTIGSICWLAANADVVPRITAGLVLTGLGDASGFTYKRSRRGDTAIDQAAAHVLRAHAGSAVIDFSPYGYDERQFCSPGYDLPVGRLTRGVHGEYPQYHTSGDDLAFVDDGRLDESVDTVLSILAAVDGNAVVRNLAPHGEPQLGRRGLYSAMGGALDNRSVEVGYLWVLSLADGTHDLLTIAERSGLSMAVIVEAARRLEAAGLLGRP